MVIVCLINRVGNQLFQYAYALSLAKKGYDVKFDGRLINDLVHYNCELEFAPLDEVKGFVKSLKGVGKNSHVFESNTSFDEDLLYPEPEGYICGYFQSELYFRDIRDDLLKSFVLTDPLSNYSEGILESINESKISVSIHFRRGDYDNVVIVNNILGCCPLSYYESAMKLIEERFDKVSYYVFSDDIEWVKENFQIDNSVYVDCGGRFSGEDIFLMSQCDHNIIANSTFSWWGGWLNEKEDKVVVCPKDWYADESFKFLSNTLIPDSWTQL